MYQIQCNYNYNVFLSFIIYIYIILTLIYSKQNDESFHIEWNDGHETILSSSFLKRNCNSNSSRKERSKNQQPLLWTKDTLHHIPTVTYANVMNNNSSLLEWLNNIQTEGICMIKECGKDENVVVCRIG